jgi:hypothetical protein
MHLLADASSFLGSVWFAGMLCLAGYIAGNLLPVSRLTNYFR